MYLKLLETGKTWPLLRAKESNTWFLRPKCHRVYDKAEKICRTFFVMYHDVSYSESILILHYQCKR